MLYSEFLIGTEAPDNMHTYAEYKRIEAIYNNDNSMEKKDAYNMYQKPDEFTKSLLEEISRLRAENSELQYKNKKQSSQIEDMSSQIRTLESNQKWNAEYLKELQKNLCDALYTLEDKLSF